MGEMLAVVGASGVGKSTLLHIIGGLERPSEGKVLYGDLDVYSLSNDGIARFRNERVGFVFQFHHLLPEFTALENVMMPALIRRVDREEAAEAATVLLDEVGLGRRLHHRPGELSGGEQQRVAVARALVVNPDVVLADEPTGNLDSHTGENIHDLLKDINRKKGVTFVIVTHNDKLAVRADRVLRMTDGTLTPQTMT
ncbi:MAG TPA: lipoprotein-releasing system ATP-binding protein LolD [Nitrospiraceae bacterium]|nr:lipoprotein-releasing system ATP-binding protein LolD [Nitrospiraceae bacterium]